MFSNKPNHGSLSMKLKFTMTLFVAGLCSQSYAELVVFGKGQANQNQTTLNASATPSKVKASNSAIQKTCNEMSKVANKAITARLNGERVHTIQGEVNDMFHNLSSPVKNDRTFNFMAHKVILSAYSEKNLPPSSDRKAVSSFKNKFSQNQKSICIDYMNKTALK